MPNNRIPNTVNNTNHVLLPQSIAIAEKEAERLNAAAIHSIGGEIKFATLVKIVGGGSSGGGGSTVMGPMKSIVPTDPLPAPAAPGVEIPLLIDPLGRLIVTSSGDSGGEATALIGTVQADPTVPALPGAETPIRVDASGQILLAGFNEFANALDVNIINNGDGAMFGPVLLINGENNTFHTAWTDLSDYNSVKLQIITDGSNVDLDIGIEHNMLDAYYSVHEIKTIRYNDAESITRTIELDYANANFKNIRVTIPRYLVGTVTVILMAANK